MVSRGDIWWGELPEPRGVEPGYSRPLLVIQSDTLNVTRLQTAIVAVITSNLRRSGLPGNYYLDRKKSGLEKDSVVILSQIYTIDLQFLTEHVHTLSPETMQRIDAELRFVLGIGGKQTH